METTSKQAVNGSATSEFAKRIETSISESTQTSRPFAVILLQIANFEAFKNQRGAVVTNNILRELQTCIRNAVHASQFVGIHKDGLGLVFGMSDVGQIDVLCKKLIILVQRVIASGKYNDLSSRWTDIIQQFLMPGKASLIYGSVGWAIYPRDGRHAPDLINRAAKHLLELEKYRKVG